jgi:hypothetical protein
MGSVPASHRRNHGPGPWTKPRHRSAAARLQRRRDQEGAGGGTELSTLQRRTARGAARCRGKQRAPRLDPAQGPARRHRASSSETIAAASRDPDGWRLRASRTPLHDPLPQGLGAVPRHQRRAGPLRLLARDRQVAHRSAGRRDVRQPLHPGTQLGAGRARRALSAETTRADASPGRARLRANRRSAGLQARRVEGGCTPFSRPP